MENEGMNITVIGVLAIAGVIALAILLVRALREQRGNEQTSEAPRELSSEE